MIKASLGNSVVTNAALAVLASEHKSEFSKEKLEEKWVVFGRSGAPVAEKSGITLYAKPCLIEKTINGQKTVKEGVEYWFENQRGNRVQDFDGGFAEHGHYEIASYEKFEESISMVSLRDFKAKPILMDKHVLRSSNK